MTEEFDLVVVGTGAAGTAPALRCAREGWRVAVVDELPYGGTCALRGCDPKKVLIGAAEAVDLHRRMRGRGVAGHAELDWPELMRFKRTFTDPVPGRREERFQKAGVETLHGSPRFMGPDRLELDGRVLAARHFVVATGAQPRRLGIPGEDLVRSSTEFLDLENLPEHITFIGAGYISFEFAHLARRAGTRATILGRGRPLAAFEPRLVGRLVTYTRELGISVEADAEVVGVERSGGRLRVRAKGASGLLNVETDLVIHGAGRVPATGRLALEAGEVETAADGAVAVNDYLQSDTNPRVYAAGDAVRFPGGPPLTPVAGYEGGVVASNLVGGNHRRVEYSAVPSVVFTIPPLASVGLTREEAEVRGMEVRVEEHDTAEWFSNRRVGQECAAATVVVDSESDEVVGAHLLGAHAEEVVNVFMLAISQGVTATALRHLLYAYPTSGSDIPYLA